MEKQLTLPANGKNESNDPERQVMKDGLDKNYDVWNPSGRELFLHSDYYQDPPGEVSGIDEGWEGMADDDALWKVVSEIGQRGVVNTVGLDGAELAEAAQYNRYIRDSVNKLVESREQVTRPSDPTS